MKVYPSNQVRFGLALRKRRLSLGLSQEALADSIEMNRSYYWKVEHGWKNLKMDTVEVLCKGVKAKVWQIYKEADEIKDVRALTAELKDA
jgi:transcriptional regulator with XRE-family HTH domain